ncbi:hypothetical protein BGZ94_008275 [Podila epigama]|nr:hypothetical protein BGZ94_008275 [Podila epigama]
MQNTEQIDHDISTQLAVAMERTSVQDTTNGHDDTGHRSSAPGPQAHNEDSDSFADAWADQGHFPLSLHKVSHSSISARGGSRITFTGENFRGGVQVAFEYPKLGVTKVVIPKVLTSTEMEVISPSLLEWCSLFKEKDQTRELCLSISLLCGGVKDSADRDTTVKVIAHEDSERELLYLILDLHRQIIRDTLGNGLDTEAEHAARRRTLTLLNLEQPPNVSRSEHMALSVIYMLCDGVDLISPAGMEMLLSRTAEGHDMLHLAVILGQTTLVREIARHLLGHFQKKPMTEDVELYAQDCNGRTAIDFARELGLGEIEQVLEATQEAANEFKKAALQMSKRALPPLPSPNVNNTDSTVSTPSPYTGSPSVAGATLSTPAMTPQVLNRPLPPTPSVSNSTLEGGPMFFSPVMASARLPEPRPHAGQPLQYQPPSHPPPPVSVTSYQGAAPDSHTGLHRVNTAQAFVAEPSLIQEHGYPSSTPAIYAPPSNPPPPPPMSYPPQYPPPQQHQYYDPTRVSYYPSEPTPHSTPLLPPASYPGALSSSPSVAASTASPLLGPSLVSSSSPSYPSMPVPDVAQTGAQHYGFLNEAPPPVHPVHPQPPLRANSTPLPYRPSMPQPFDSQPDISQHPSALNGSRPLPPAPFTPPTPLPPPKHIVRRVNRPKQFTIPTTEQA